MKIFFDWEFYENGRFILPISVGMVAEDGREYYAETVNARRLCRNSEWLMENVEPHLTAGSAVRSLDAMREDIIAFAGKSPEFWAYYASYDWVCLAQLYGRMIDLPEGWPMFVRDIKQELVRLGNPRISVFKEAHGSQHNALADAKWNKAVHAAHIEGKG